jgi:nucleoside-diphosphate-sugar epimerase
MNRKLVVVAGGGGFIGGHLVARLLEEGNIVRSVDIKPTDEWGQVHDGAQNLCCLPSYERGAVCLTGHRDLFSSRSCRPLAGRWGSQ